MFTKLTTVKLEEGKSEEKKGKYEKDIEKYNKFLDILPAVAPILRARAEAYFKLNKIAEAKKDLEHVRLIQNDRAASVSEKEKKFIADYIEVYGSEERQTDTLIAATHAYVGRMHFILSNNPAAIIHFNAALTLCKNDKNSRNMRSSAIAALGVPHPVYDPIALADLTEAIKETPDEATYLFTRARLYRKIGDHDAALVDCFEAMQVDFDKAIPEKIREEILRYVNSDTISETSSKSQAELLREGNGLFLHRRYDEAITVFTKAINQNLKHHEAYAKRARTFWKLKNYKLALCDLVLAAWTNFHWHENNSPSILFNYFEEMRNLLADRGWLEKSIKEHETLICWSSNYEEEIKKVASSSTSSAIKQIKKINISQCHFEFADVLSSAGQRFLADDDYENAINYFDRAIWYNDDDPNYYVFLAIAHRRMQQTDKANEILSKAISRWPSHIQILSEIKKNNPAPVEVKIPEEKKAKKKEAAKPAVELKPVPSEMIVKEVLDQLVKNVVTQVQTKERAEKKEAALLEAKRKEEERLRLVRLAEEEAFEAKEKRRREHNKSRSKRKTANKNQRILVAEQARKSVGLFSPAKKIVEETKETKEPILDYAFADVESLPKVGRIPFKPIELAILKALIDSGKNNKAFMIGGSVRDRLEQVLRYPDQPVFIDPGKDIDIVTTASEEEILTSLAPFGVQKGKREGLFVFKVYDEMQNEIKFDVTASSYRTAKEDTMHRDYTINALAADMDQFVYDFASLIPSLNAVRDLLENILALILSADVSYREDPWRIVRGKHLAHARHMAIPEELQKKMKEHLPLLGTMKEVFCIHSWMMKSFSSLYVSREKAVDNFAFLIKKDLLDKLFHPADVIKIIANTDWIYKTLADGVVTRKQLYILFYTAIAKQTPDKEPAEIRKDIFSRNRLLADEFESYFGFGGLFAASCVGHEAFYNRQNKIFSLSS